jgi:abortive infection bacteriophage resistance protein
VRPLIQFDKVTLSINDQIQLLVDRGLELQNNNTATQILSKVSYYRLSPYFKPFQNPDDTFVANTNLTDIFSLYCFDRDLKHIVFQAMEKLENCLKAQISNHMSLSFGAHWYTDSRHFSTLFNHQELLDEIKAKADAQYPPNSFRHYQSRYLPQGTPASWMVFEELTLGTVSRILESLQGSNPKKGYTSPRNEICAFFGTTHNFLTSWIRTLTWVRNVCAHHGYLWQRKILFEPQFPVRKENQFLASSNIEVDKLYAALCCLQKLLVKIEITKPLFKDNLKSLIQQNPLVKPATMGFDANWLKEPIWIST